MPRICHSLLGEAADVDDQELQWRKPLDVVKQCARERWQLDTEDLIVLAAGGVVVGPASTPEECLAQGRDIFVFLRSALDPQAGSADAIAAAVCGLAPVEEEEVLGEAETSALGSLCGLGAGDPALEALQGNVAEARQRLLEVRPVVALAARAEGWLEVQRLAAQAVLDNLGSHRTACTKTMGLFMQKHDRAQDRIDQILSQVESSLVSLRAVALHPALQAGGRETLADSLPNGKIERFTANVQAERVRLAQHVEKLKQEDAQTQVWCDQAATKVQQLLQDDAVEVCTAEVRRRHVRALEEVVPSLKVRMPPEMAVAEPARVLEEEKRTAAVLEELGALCRDIRGEVVELQMRWERQRASFLQRLREVSYTQSKVRAVERRAALLEESINVQHSQAQQLSHLQKMPRAYQRSLAEVERRRRFRARFSATVEQARVTLARMAEEENARRKAFFLRYGCHLPADLALGLGGIVPTATLEVADFDAQLPDLGGGGGFGGLDPAASAGASSSGFGGFGGGLGSSRAGSKGTLAASSSAALERSLSRSSGSGGAAGAAGAAASSGGRRVAALEEQNRDLEAQVSRLLAELAAQRRGSVDSGDGGASLAPASPSSAAPALEEGAAAASPPSAAASSTPLATKPEKAEAAATAAAADEGEAEAAAAAAAAAPAAGVDSEEAEAGHEKGAEEEAAEARSQAAGDSGRECGGGGDEDGGGDEGAP